MLSFSHLDIKTPKKNKLSTNNLNTKQTQANFMLTSPIKWKNGKDCTLYI